MKKITFFICIIVLSQLSCGSNSQQDSIQFKVDYDLLENTHLIDTLNFSFAPPIGWRSDPAKPINKQTQLFQDEKLSSYFVNIKDVFYDSLSTNFCSISLVQSKDVLDLNYFTQTFKTMLAKQFSPENLKQGKFSKSEMEINQFLIMTETIVFFKLFLQPTNKHIIQLDYAIDRNIYPNYIKKIESSIGSITTI